MSLIGILPVRRGRICVIGLGVAVGFAVLRPVAAGDAGALARAIAETPFDPSTVDEGYRWIETITGEVPSEAAEYGVVAASAANFQGPSEMFRDAVAFYLIFDSYQHAEEYYEYQGLVLVAQEGGPQVNFGSDLPSKEGPRLEFWCLASAAQEAATCLYFEAALATVIQIAAAPGPRFGDFGEDKTKKDAFNDGFLDGAGGDLVSGILPAARSHLLRAAGR